MSGRIASSRPTTMTITEKESMTRRTTATATYPCYRNASSSSHRRARASTQTCRRAARAISSQTRFPTLLSLRRCQLLIRSLISRAVKRKHLKGQPGIDACIERRNSLGTPFLLPKAAKQDFNRGLALGTLQPRYSAVVDPAAPRTRNFENQLGSTRDSRT
jgi:hypothetical protein